MRPAVASRGGRELVGSVFRIAATLKHESGTDVKVVEVVRSWNRRVRPDQEAHQSERMS